MSSLGLKLIAAPIAVALLAATGFSADTPATIPASEGAIEIPFDMPADGQVTAAIYKPGGQLLRPLAQMIDVSKGKQLLRWDGLDLWGNPLPAGTEYVARVVTSPGLKAFYEFSAASPNAIPWISKTFGEGDAARTGGWLSDYAAPSAVCTVGARVYLGTTLAEYGHTLIYTNLDGEKMWGGVARAPLGPESLTTDGKQIYSLMLGRRLVLRQDLDGKNAATAVTVPRPAEGIAVRDGKLYVTAPGAGKSLDMPGPLELNVFDLGTGRLIQEIRHATAAMTRLEFAPDGTLYSLFEGKLCRSDIGTTEITHHVLSGDELKGPISLAVDHFRGDRIAVGDEKGGAVLIYDLQGKVLRKIGGITRQRGTWDGALVERPTGMAFDQRGKLWVAENVLAPKRVTRFGEDGAVEKVFYGPPPSGGGGYLDPSLKSFYVNGCEFELDWAKGLTTRLARLNDVQGDPVSPALDESAYGYTRVGRPVEFQGRQYAVGDAGYQQAGGFVVCVLENGAYRPCAVMGPSIITGGKGTVSGRARLNVFLRKDVWRDTWEKQNLAKTSFLWCDRNGDGKYQVDEVEIVRDDEVGGKPAFAGAYWGNRCGADLTFWGTNARLAPSRITDKGVPIYEKKAIKPFDYAALAARYTGLSGSYEPISAVDRAGNLTIAGQPFQVTPELKIRGGDVPSKPGAFVPPILGEKYSPTNFVGTVETNSPVGEVAMLSGSSGVWYVVSMRDSLLLGSIFTGKDGTWTGLLPARGMDVTNRRHEIGTGYGDFLRAADGKYYVVAGKGFHGICRVEGLNDFKVTEATRKITEAEAESNKQIYSRLIATTQAGAARSRTRPTLQIAALAGRAKEFKLDGDLAEWGKTNLSSRMGSPFEKYSFDAAYDAKGIYLACAGYCGMGNAAEDAKFLFTSGFAIDLMVRSKSAETTGRVLEGDRRIVFGQHKGQWIGVLYDYVNAAAAPGESFDFESQVARTHVARVVELPKEQAQVSVREIAGPKNADDKKAWTAELFVSWDTLGVKFEPGATFRADVGVLAADSGGIQVERRAYWSHIEADAPTDPAVGAQLLPATWGTMKLGPAAPTTRSTSAPAR